MRVLLTNDDGIRAPGIVAMYEALTDAAGVLGGPIADHSPGATARSPRCVTYPVAPLTVQSATSHGVTFHTPLMVREEQVTPAMLGVGVDGRPADCVKLAIAAIWPDRFGAGSRPDLVISGMNAGANCGINVIYSGTVAAALEAAFLGVPSIAVSMMLGKGKPRFDVGAAWARRTIERLLASGLPSPHECLSINIPVIEDVTLSPQSPLPPVHICPMNTHGLVDKYERRHSPGGGVYYWAAGYGLDFHATDDGSDVAHLMAGHITVTPLKYDLTRADTLEKWRSRAGGGA
ncbi:MAG: 5'/3'-nucleotidase SurE [Phycisphaeraceae bacterium]|nr:5'/3'-nucleotidase SurE [Phycisphaeraceae bacterium]